MELRLGHARALLLACLVTVSAASTAGEPDGPRRIVSINICGDLLALTLAPRERVASVTFLAGDSLWSPIAALAEGMARNHGNAEEVLSLDPDLVLAGRYTARDTVNLLRRLGYPVLELDIAESLDDARAQIRTAAAAMGVASAGEAMIGDLDVRLAAGGAGGDGARPLAVVYGPNGYTLGPRSLSGALVALAGFDNLAARAGIPRVGPLPMEQLLLARPDLLILESESSHAPALATGMLAHPALAGLRERIAVVEIPRPLWSCPGPWLADALDRLSTARQALAP